MWICFRSETWKLSEFTLHSKCSREDNSLSMPLQMERNELFIYFPRLGGFMDFLHVHKMRTFCNLNWQEINQIHKMLHQTIFILVDENRPLHFFYFWNAVMNTFSYRANQYGTVHVLATATVLISLPIVSKRARKVWCLLIWNSRTTKGIRLCNKMKAWQCQIRQNCKYKMLFSSCILLFPFLWSWEE